MRSARGAGITIVGKVINFAVSLGFAIMLARVLGAEQYGIYRLTFTIVAITAAICMMGLDGGMKRFIPLARTEGRPDRLWGAIQIGLGIPAVVSTVVALGISLAADFISTDIFGTPDLAPVLRVGSIAIPLLTFLYMFQSIVIGFKRIEYGVYARDIGMESIKALFSVIALLLGFGILAIAGSYVLAAGICAVMLGYWVNRLFRLSRPIRSAERNTREMFYFSIPLFGSMLLSQFGRRLETLALGIFSVVADVGIYAALLSFASIGLLVLVGFRNIVTPLVSELYSEKKIEELKSLYQTVAKWGMTFNLPFFLGLLFFAETLLGILGEEFIVGATALVIVGFGNLFNASTGLCATLISYTGHSRVTMFNSAAYLITSIILDVLLIPALGLLGAALAGSITIVILNTIRLYQVYRLVERILPFNVSFYKPIVASAVAGGVTLLLREFFLTDWPVIQMVVLLVIMCSIYGFILLKLKLSYEDQIVLDRVKKAGIIKRFTRKGGRPRNKKMNDPTDGDLSDLD